LKENLHKLLVLQEHDVEINKLDGSCGIEAEGC
jgi:hypothetical protein